MSAPLPRAPWLGMAENLVLRAGAGTGKTHALITLALGLLAGLRRGRPVAPNALWLLTFTEEAAGELRARLRERMAPLAEGGDPDVLEPQLAAAAQALDRPLPPAARWREFWEQVGDVRASTLHGACGALLRELGGPSLAGFAQLDEEASNELLRAAAQETILSADTALTQALLEDLGYRGAGDFSLGLVESLCAVQKKLAEDGLGGPPAADATAKLTADLVRRALAEAREALGVAAPTLRLAELTRAAAFLAGVPSEGEDAAAAMLEAGWRDLQEARDAIGAKRAGGAREAKDALKALGEALGARRAALHVEPFRLLLAETGNRYAEKKLRRGALDFADLCTRARDLLRDDRVARAEAKAKVAALLLDETQDTSRVQVDLCLLLSEARGAEAALDASRGLTEQLALEPGILCAVGDRKQSIYEFRGANVAVFEELAGALLKQGGRSEVLAVSRRSRPALVTFVNAFFAGAMAEGGPGAPGFTPEDALSAHRPAVELPVATLLALEPAKGPDGSDEDSESTRRREARAVAAKVASLTRNPPPALREAVGGEVRPGHIALLLRSAGRVDLFRAALSQVGLPSVLLKGDGFWESAEIQDAAALLAAIVDPGDALAALTLLRSPLCGVLDATVGRFALSGERKGLRLQRLWNGELPESIAGEERERLLAFGVVLRSLRQAGQGLGATGVLEAVELQHGLRSRYADPQASANLDKLVGRLAGWQAQGATLAAAARRLWRATRDAPREPLAPAIDGSDRDAVRLLTVHGAKGLEFPVVFVVDCGRAPLEESPPALYARDAGLSLKGRGPEGAWVRPADYRRIADEAKARARAEERRLLYVAATRAQDLLFFSGELPGKKAETWRGLLDTYGPGAGLERVSVTGAELAPPPGPLFGEAPTPEPEPRAALLATAELPRLKPKRLPLAASAAGDLGLCQRRYQLRQLWRLPETAGAALDLPDDLPAEDDPRALGSLAHRLLETVDLAAAAKNLETALAEAARQVSVEAVDPQLLDEVRGVLRSALGQEMLTLPPERVRREVPFVLRLGEEPRLVVTGSIDLLLFRKDELWVIDYKRGPPKKTASYEAQLRLYALAARELVGGAVPLRAGLWFLRQSQVGPQSVDLDAAGLERWRRNLERSAAEVAGRDGRGTLFPGIEVKKCRALGCGYVGRCHGAAR